MSLVLVRHGETDWSRSGRHTGTTDVPLSDEGRAEASALRAVLHGRRFAAVLTSPSSRARDTCRLAGLGDAEIDDDLREWAYGEFEGRTTDEIRGDLPGWTIWTGPWRGGETVEQVGDRLDRVLARVARIPGDVAVFSHGHALRVLAARWLGQLPAFGARLALGTASISELGLERERHVVTSWNVRLGP